MTQTAPRRPKPPGAWGLRAQTASRLVPDGSPSTPRPSLSASRKPHARGPTHYSDRLLRGRRAQERTSKVWDSCMATE